MIQIKLFRHKTPDLETFENIVNEFLRENADRIIVKDIKYTAEMPNPANTVWALWTAMIIYETV